MNNFVPFDSLIIILFSIYKSLNSLIKCIPKYFVAVDTIINVIFLFVWKG